MATYKAQFRSRHRRQMEDIYTYVETLQHLANLEWPFMDCHAKEETVVYQFLLGMGNHELSVQVAAYGHRRMEDRWKLLKRRKSSILKGTNPAPKHASSQTSVITHPRPSNW